jgi:hypothetical protein
MEENKEISLEYINSIIKEKIDKEETKKNLKEKKDIDLLKELYEAVNNEMVGKCINMDYIYMKISSVDYIEGQNYFTLYGIKISTPYHAFPFEISENGIILIDTRFTFCKRMKIISENEFMEIHEKAIDAINKKANSDYKSKSDNNTTISDTVSHIKEVYDDLDRIDEEISTISNKLNSLLLNYFNKKYLNNFIEMDYDCGKYTSISAHILKIWRETDDSFIFEGNAICVDKTGVQKIFVLKYPIVISTGNFNSLNIITKEEFNQKCSNLLKEIQG